MPPRRRPANFSSVSQAAAIIKQPSASMKDKAAALRYLAESGNYPDPTGPPPQVPPESLNAGFPRFARPIDGIGSQQDRSPY